MNSNKTLAGFAPYKSDNISYPSKCYFFICLMECDSSVLQTCFELTMQMTRVPGRLSFKFKPKAIKNRIIKNYSNKFFFCRRVYCLILEKTFSLIDFLWKLSAAFLNRALNKPA